MSGITSIQGSQIFSGNADRAYNVSTKSVSETEKQNTAQNTNENVTTSKDGDTVEISAAGTARSAKTYTAMSSSSGTVSKDEGYTSKMAETVSNATSSVGITETSAAKNEMSAQSAAVSGSSSGSSSSSTGDLSSYSASELKEMLQNGEITQAENDAEMKSRSSSSEDSGTEEETAVSGNGAATETEA